MDFRQRWRARVQNSQVQCNPFSGSAGARVCVKLASAMQSILKLSVLRNHAL
jgi:hypothetical protein